MENIKRIIAGMIAVSAFMTAAVSCSEKKTKSVPEDLPGEEELGEGKKIDIKGQSITWLADYDLNPSKGEARSAALAMFEDYYGAKVKFVETDADNKFTKLSSMILAGEEVDMFPYETKAFPNGVLNDQYEALDPYFDVMGMEDGLWDGMKSTIDTFTYNGSHYVVPYSLSDTLMLTYSRKQMEEEKLEDPYKLYTEGKWTWSKFTEMMETFVKNGEPEPAEDEDDEAEKAPAEPNNRRGICGEFGQALLQSTGHTVVTYDGTKFTNNISDAEIVKAGTFLNDLRTKGLIDYAYRDSLPSDGTVLFFAASDWALPKTNAENQGREIMVVPFPKADSADKNYITCNFNAKMLVKNSKKGEAVAAYLKCERIAAEQAEYKDIAKQEALAVRMNASGSVRSFITEEQYDAMQSFLDTEKNTPVFDFSYGMGAKMFGNGDYTYETRGVMDNLTSLTLPSQNDEPVDIDALRASWSAVVDTEVARFNKNNT